MQRACAHLHEGAAPHVEHELWEVGQVLVQQEACWVILAILSKPAAKSKERVSSDRACSENTTLRPPHSAAPTILRMSAVYAANRPVLLQYGQHVVPTTALAAKHRAV
jgi:hypothetical protein